MSYLENCHFRRMWKTPVLDIRWALWSEFVWKNKILKCEFLWRPRIWTVDKNEALNSSFLTRSLLGRKKYYLLSTNRAWISLYSVRDSLHGSIMLNNCCSKACRRVYIFLLYSLISTSYPALISALTRIFSRANCFMIIICNDEVNITLVLLDVHVSCWNCGESPISKMWEENGSPIFESMDFQQWANSRLLENNIKTRDFHALTLYFF